MGSRDDFVDCSGHSRTWLSRNSRGIQNRLPYSCGPGHARLCHFLLDAGTCRVGAFFAYVSYAAYTYHDIEMEALQSPFAQLPNLRPIPAGGPHRHIRDGLPK